MALVEVDNLVKHFPKRGGVLNRVIAQVHAVTDVSFQIRAGETLGVVGESGCGKSTLGKVVMRLLDPTSGSIRFDNCDISRLSYAELLPFRRRMQIIFQDPNSSLNPRMTVASTLREPISVHNIAPRGDREEYIDQLLDKVGLRVDDRSKFPHEFSGGQKQRIGIARALSMKPEFIFADEPVSALDVSIQAQVLNLLLDLKDEYSLTLLFVSHDLKVIDFFCDRMLVMYLGRLMEEMPCTDIHREAQHPYTQALLKANPAVDPAQRQAPLLLEGDVPSPYDPPPGCPFATRCPLVEERCLQQMPPMVEIGKDHRLACWVVNDSAESTATSASSPRDS